MPELTGDQLAAFTTAFNPLCDTLSSALSEGVNQLVACDPPAIEQKALDALMLSVEPVLQTSFAYPGLCPDEALLLFSEADAGVIADLIAGGDGSKPAAPVDDDRIDQVAAAMGGVVQGLGAAIGAALGAPVEAAPSVSTTMAALTLPAAFLAAGTAVEIAIPFRIAGLLDSSLRLLLTPDLALAIVGGDAGIAAADGDAQEAADADDAPEFPAEAEGDAQAEEPLDAPFDPADLPDPSAGMDAADPSGPVPMDLPSFDSPATGAPDTDVFGAAGGAGGFGGFGSPAGAGGGGAFGGFGMAPAPPGSNPFQAFQATGGAFETMPRGMDLIMDIPLDVTVELGRVQMLIKDVLDLATGSIVELERVAGEPIDLLVNGQLIAKGEVVVIEDNFGIRITEIVSPSDRLNSVGKRG